MYLLIYLIIMSLFIYLNLVQTWETKDDNFIQNNKLHPKRDKTFVSHEYKKSKCLHKKRTYSISLNYIIKILNS